MRTIIAGSRNITDPQIVADAVAASGWAITVVISGAARGVDTLGEAWAAEHGVQVERYPADWKRHGKVAGPMRNRQMAAVAEALVAIPGPASRGTWDMIRRAEFHGLRVYVHPY